MGEFLKALGIVGVLACAYLLNHALGMEVAVNPDGQGYVANLQLMHIQLVTVLVGTASGIVGVVLFVGGVIVARMKREAPPPSL